MRPPLRFAIAALALLLGSVAASSAQPSRIDLYTMGPGDTLFSKFGHAALCVIAKPPARSLCYNYGTADFSQPLSLSWAVMQRRAQFWVSVATLEEMLLSFEFQDRSIYRQPLSLSEAKVERLAKILATEALPENRNYTYDHFSENCSTRPRDHIDAITDGALREVRWRERPTYRDHVLQGIGSNWGLALATDLFLGRSLDRETSAFEAMFLPKELRRAVEERFGVSPEEVYARRAPLPMSHPLATERWLWSLLTVLGATWGIAILLGPERVSRTSRKLAGLVLGGAGSLLLLGAIVSPAPEIRINELLLVFLCTDFFLMRDRAKQVLVYAALRLAELLIVTLLVVAGILIQPLWGFWGAVVLVVAAVCFRKGRLLLAE